MPHDERGQRFVHAPGTPRAPPGPRTAPSAPLMPTTPLCAVPSSQCHSSPHHCRSRQATHSARFNGPCVSRTSARRRSPARPGAPAPARWRPSRPRCETRAPAACRTPRAKRLRGPCESACAANLERTGWERSPPGFRRATKAASSAEPDFIAVLADPIRQSSPDGRHDLPIVRDHFLWPPECARTAIIAGGTQVGFGAEPPSAAARAIRDASGLRPRPSDRVVVTRDADCTFASGAVKGPPARPRSGSSRGVQNTRETSDERRLNVAEKKFADQSNGVDKLFGFHSERCRGPFEDRCKARWGIVLGSPFNRVENRR